MKKKKSSLRSTCCDAEVKYSDPAPDFIGDKHPRIGTVYCICSKCGEPCNIMSIQRRTWTRSPVTQVLKDKRKKITETQLDKELREARD
jgi:hypothetical protein